MDSYANCNNNTEGEMYTMDYTKQSNRNIDEMLDNINFSDEEEEKNKFKLDEETYKREMQKIQGLYEEEDVTGTMNTYTGTKHELDKMKEIPVPFDLSLNSKMLLCGIVNHIVEDKVLIDQCLNNKIVNLDNIIFNKNNIALGYIDDVIGNIDSPIYVMKIYPNLIDNNISINKGEEMFICEDKASLVNKEDLMKKKGCDASNAFDEEVLNDEMEYSDDEQELQIKAIRRQQKKKEMFPIKKMKYDQQQQQQIYMSQQQGHMMMMPLIQPQKQTAFSPFINPEYKFQPPQQLLQQQQYQQQIDSNYANSNYLMSNMMLNKLPFGNMSTIMNNAMQQGINPFAKPCEGNDPQINLNQYPPSS